MDNISPLQHLSFLSDHMEWNSMSWEARGMALELMTLGDFDHHMGTIPMEDDLWRTTLGLPTQRSIQMALKKSIQGRGMREQNELDVVWSTVWKTELLRWFIKIDAGFLSTHPQYKGCEGRYWHPLLERMNEVTVQKQRAPSKRGLSRADAAKPIERVSSKRSKKILPDPAWDYPPIRYTPTVLRRCWDVPLTEEVRASFWDTAGRILGTHQAAKAFLGKQIKDFGEQHVAAAIAQLATRPSLPADPQSFLLKQLKNLTQGSNAVQRARQQRVKVPL